jgi:hypothetical protein
MYPEFVHEIEDESGLKIDLRSVGTIVLSRSETAGQSPAATQAYLLPRPLTELEPALRPDGSTALFLQERCVDPRDLTGAAIAAARHRGIDFRRATEWWKSKWRTAKRAASALIRRNLPGAWW